MIIATLGFKQLLVWLSKQFISSVKIFGQTPSICRSNDGGGMRVCGVVSFMLANEVIKLMM